MSAAFDKTPPVAPANGEPVLQVKNLRVELKVEKGVFAAVDDVSFSLREGETLGVVGESGCGKSMTALAVMGLLPKPIGRISQGEIRLRGIGNLEKSRESTMKQVRGNHISMIFQEPMTSLNPVFTVGFQISEAIRIHQSVDNHTVRKRAIDMLELVGIPLPELRYDAYPHQLSGGMRQRVMIAMALSCRPKVMLADEPTTALDVTIQAQILKLMNLLKDEIGTSIVFITHDLGVIAKMTQRVLVMYAGVVVEEASVRDLFRQPLHPYTAGLLRSIPRVDPAVGRARRLHTIKGVVPSLMNLPRGCRFSDRCPDVHDRCRQSEPPLIAQATGPNGGRRVRCWLHEASPADG